MTEDFNPALFCILGFEGAEPPDDFIRLIERYNPAGFIFFERNYRSPQKLSLLISDLKSRTSGNPLYCVDQEPGRVRRFKEYFPVSEKPSYYVEGSHEGEFRSWCSETAALLAEIGINLNLAPVLDISPFSSTPVVLRDRTFGNDPLKVSSLAGILIEEHRKRNVLTCGKHFPGLGSAEYDPHERLSISDESLEKFKSYHWKPFSNAIQRDVNMIMTTHLKAHSIDPENPATYSSITIDYLNDDLGFKGAVISDDLIMAGAGNPNSIGESAARAIMAGHNLVIISRGVAAQTAALEYMKNLYARDDLFRKIADDNEKIIRQLGSKIGHQKS